MPDRERNFLGKIGEAVESSAQVAGIPLTNPLVGETAQDVIKEYRNAAVQEFVPLLVQRSLTKRLREASNNGKNGPR